MVMVQDTWQQMLQNAKKKFTNTFWNYFLPFHSCSGVVIDTALASVKKVFLRNFLSTKECRAFPGSRRQMMSKLGCIDEFWSLLGHTHRIDLTSFNLPSGTRHIDFRFIDPVWAWIMSARNQCPHGMHWKPAAQPRHKPVYGGGIQYGELFRQAYSKCIAGSSLMLMTLHWDGTGCELKRLEALCVKWLLEGATTDMSEHRAKAARIMAQQAIKTK